MANTQETLSEQDREMADRTLQWLEDNKDTGCGLLMDPEQSDKISLRRIELGQYKTDIKVHPEGHRYAGEIYSWQWNNADGTKA